MNNEQSGKTAEFAVGETVWIHFTNGRGLWDPRPWRIAKVGPKSKFGLAIELHAGPENRCAVGASTIHTFVSDPELDFLTLRRERELSGDQLDLFASLEVTR
jgi:hypothetical protein